MNIADVKTLVMRALHPHLMESIDDQYVPSIDDCIAIARLTDAFIAIEIHIHDPKFNGSYSKIETSEDYKRPDPEDWDNEGEGNAER